MSVLGVSVLESKVFCDTRGDLGVIESNRDIPFEIKRIYYLYNSKNENRGGHAHKDLKQYMICLSGQCTLELDDGKNKKSYLLQDQKNGLLLNGVIWRDIVNMSSDCVLLVLASNYYESDDYIHSYCEFKDWVSK